MNDMIYTQDEIQELLQDVRVLVTDLGWDYERLTQGGQGVYNELCHKLGVE